MSKIQYSKFWGTENLVIRFLPILVGVSLVFMGGVSNWDRAIYDSFQRLSQRAPDSDIVVISVDQKSLDALGRWPWPRSIHANLIDILSTSEVSVIGLDFIFSEPSENETDDTLLASAIKNNGNVILPVLNEQLRIGGQLKEVLPLPLLIDGAAQLGHIDRPLDSDSVSRSSFLKAGLGDAHWSSFALAIVEWADSVEIIELPGIVKTQPEPEIKSQLIWQRDNQIWISYTGPPGHYQHVSYWDILSGVFPVAELKNKIALVGATAAGLGDVLPTPVSGNNAPMSGIEIVANEIDTLLNNRAILPLNLAQSLLVTTILIGILTIFLPVLSAKWSLPLTLFLSMTVTILSVVFFFILNLWFAPSSTLVGLFFGYIFWSWRRLIHTVKHLNRTLLRLESEPVFLSQNIVTGFTKTMSFIASILPIDAATIKDFSGNTSDSWFKRNLISQANGWHSYPAKHSVLNIHWNQNDSPSETQSRFLTSLAHKFEHKIKKNRVSPIERIERKIQQVEKATDNLQSMRLFITDTLSELNNGILVINDLGLVVLNNPSSQQLLAPHSNSKLNLDGSNMMISDCWNLLKFGPGNDAKIALQSAFLNRDPAELHAQNFDSKDLLVNLVPFDFGTGEGGLIIQLTDITGIREAERGRRDILSFLSHDLRSPLSSILAATELISLNKEINPESQFFKQIKDSAEHTLKLADDFLSLLMAEGSSTSYFEKLDLISTIKLAISLVNTHAENKHIDIHFKSIENAQVLGNPQLLERLFVNLTNNAIKYSAEHKEVNIELELKENQYQCHISDQGYGIDEANIKNLFRRFRRIYRTEHQNEKGSGLGLLFVKTVVQSHGGTITAKSKINQGSTFTVTLPIISK